MKNPIVSIVIPCFNREEFIIKTLDSIKSQTLESWECIIVDDGSTNHSIELIRDPVKETGRKRRHRMEES